ncbi:hypothetical protein CDL12_18748 [Handroanthus impetiginosus]|uniref:Uncharacterized protein n=1 Tax=Handroanthus impetiginosus TaxID=429701 RepID=A0A2G9GTR6_9LAMI|nr:hypothetical protein CDL12_18748 [Handroanthus impetiginosus]
MSSADLSCIRAAGANAGNNDRDRIGELLMKLHLRDYGNSFKSFCDDFWVEVSEGCHC